MTRRSNQPGEYTGSKKRAMGSAITGSMEGGIGRESAIRMGMGGASQWARVRDHKDIDRQADQDVGVNLSAREHHLATVCARRTIPFIVEQVVALDL